MKFHIVGSYLPQDYLISARNDFENGRISPQDFRNVEDRAIDELVELQLKAGVPSVSGGELRRKYWDRDFYFGLNGIERERVDTGRIYQDRWAYSNQISFTDRISYNPQHPFFEFFTYLYNKVDGRARCRQTLPSPADLYLTILDKAEGQIERLYPWTETLLNDIVDAYRNTILHFYKIGCRSIQLDDSACGRLTDPAYADELLRGGVDIMQLQNNIVKLLQDTLTGLPDDMWKTVYLSSGPTIVPDWNAAETTDNIMPRILAMDNVDRFYMPFNTSKPETAEILRFVNPHAAVALGLVSAHTPFHDKLGRILDFIALARTYIQPDDRLSISPKTGFKLTSYASRGLMFEDQWRKIDDIKALAATI
jgi:methionine synthase II (cobalamin-independent)